MTYVTAFGAVGDGVTKDTQAVQRAIDCGGVIAFPPGTYLCGTLYLRDDIALELAPGAVLLASPDQADYNTDDFAPDNHVYEMECVTGAHFIIARNCHNVTIRGGGRIDGNRAAIYDLPAAQVCSYETISWRPGQMIFFQHSSNITIADVELTNSPYWNCFLYNCTDVQIRGLRIKNPMHTPNGDGLDLDACRRVTVSDCIIETGDDCIALRACGDFGADQPVCENICITNCILTTVCNAVRLGVGAGVIRNVSMDNCTIIGSRTGICFVTKYFAGASLQIEDCMFSQLRIEAERPFSFHSNAWGRKLGPVTRKIENILLCNIRGTVCAGCLIDAYAPGNIRNLTFDNVVLTLQPQTGYSEYRDADYDFTENTDLIPRAAWLIRNAADIHFRACDVLHMAAQPDISEKVCCGSTVSDGNLSVKDDACTR